MSNPLSPLFTWIKANKLSAFLLAVAAFLILRVYAGSVTPMPYRNFDSDTSYRGGVMMDSNVEVASAPMMAKTGVLPIVGGGNANTVAEIAPSDQMIARTTYLSLKVQDVPEVIRQSEVLATQLGGFFVNSSVSAADEDASGSITLRVPSVKRDEALTQLRQLGVRVISESIQGTDITDEFQDVTEELRILTSTKTRFESLLNKAETIADMLDAQRELLNLQRQIDSLKGQQEYLKKSAEFTLITAYLSTDELALPYSTPGQTWRPGVVFKEAVRSFLVNLRGLGNTAIWIGVYTPIWLPILGGYIWWNKKRSNN
ncbi:MAG TPA: hypothetical protein DEP87_00340 [Candidatus Pacebacteria bacterium]|nr:hypothetical protein [Candidatus Paceibacterota bacterium]